MSRVELLRDATTVLASEPAAQLQYLEQLGVAGVVDELALEYDDVASAAKDMLQAGEIDRVQYEAIQSLSKYLDDMSGAKNKNLWQPENLSVAPEWETVRRLADHLLSALSGKSNS